MSAEEYLKRLDETPSDEELLPKVSQVVGDAIDKIRTYALPYFLETARG
jgi:hypothetical protein